MGCGPRDAGGLLVGLLLVLALLGGIAVVVDRVAAHFAERAIATRLKTAAAIADTPAVTVTGWPFLTQLFAHDLDEVDVGTNGYRAGSVTLARLDVQLHHAWRTGTTLTAKTVQGTADVDLAELQRLVGPAVQLSDTGGHLLVTVTVAGRHVTGTATPSIRGTKLHLVGHATTPVSATLPAVDVPLPDLPWGLAITDVQVTETGIRLTGSGVNVDVTKR